MDKTIQKDLQLIILVSQNPPRVTLAKTSELDLTVFIRVGTLLYSHTHIYCNIDFFFHTVSLSSSIDLLFLEILPYYP